MSIKHLLWEKRTEFRGGELSEYFDLGKLGRARPEELRFGLPEASRAEVVSCIGEKSALRGNWDTETCELDLAESPAEQTDTHVTVAIGREGDAIVVDGFGELLRARGKEEAIPVRVGLVHAQWQKFRNQIMNFVDAHKGRVYQKIHHPDLIRIPWLHGDERLELMKPEMPITSGTVLDIGANWGYWSHALTRLGLTCTAIDYNPKNALFVRKLRRAMSGTFEFRQMSVFDLPGVLSYDLVLGLNIFHHFLRYRDTFELFVDLLGRLDTDHMFFEPHCPEELAADDAYRNMEMDEFVQFIVDNSCMTQSRLLGTVTNGRKLYLLSR